VVPEDERRATRATWKGFDIALGRAVELVGTTLVFVLIGLWIDSRLGTKPLFTVVLGLIAVIGQGLIAYSRYQDQMAREEEGKPWKQSR
jgi:F0F1-type ATP synthase assembly protein I